MGRSSSDKQGYRIHSQGMQVGEALPAQLLPEHPGLAGNQGDMLRRGASATNGSVTAA